MKNERNPNPEYARAKAGTSRRPANATNHRTVKKTKK